MLHKPNVVTLPSCDFPLEETYGGGRTILVLPRELRRLFHEEGAHVVRIHSVEVANIIPDFGSEASGDHSFLPHKDNFGDDKDPKRYLVLSKTTRGARGSRTLACTQSAAYLMLAQEEDYFKQERERLGTERAYNSKFQVSKAQYNQCFDSLTGYESVAQQLTRTHPHIPPYTIRLNLLNYLIRGSLVEPLMQELMRSWGHWCVEEPWEDGGVLIIDNAAVFHLRVGGNYPPLKRNFCT